MHPLFVIIMLGSVLTGYFHELFTLFILVIVHELGHVVAARGFGWTVREVKLLPFGGVAEVEEAGVAPIREEIAVALAGPLQNVWMGFAAWCCGQLGLWEPGWAEYIWKANLMLGLFNLLPIYPLDGGKLLQATLSRSINYYRTLVWTVRMSLCFSIGMLIVAMLPLLEGDGIQLNLMIVAAFLLVSNWTYSRNLPYVFYRFLLHRSHAAMNSLARGKTATPLIVDGTQSVLSVARLFYRGHYHLIYLVGAHGTGVQVLPEQAIVESCLSHANPGRAVSELFR